MNKRIILAVVLGLMTFSDVNYVCAQDNASQHQRHGIYITKNEAINIAYKHAGVSADSVTICKVKTEREKGRIIYEVEFISGKTEYEFDVDAITGKIIDLDGNPSLGPEAPHNGFIGVEKAKKIAFSHAGIREDSDTKLVKVKLDRDDGLIIYELDFFANQKKYEYEIDAITGKVLEVK